MNHKIYVALSWLILITPTMKGSAMDSDNGTVIMRKSEERGHANFGWLDSRHSFSFGHYYDPEHMGFGCLRVINQDLVSPGKGFDTHRHENMEIFSYVIEGALAHKDTLGNERKLKKGEFQYMSAGDGISHSEFNPSDTEECHFLQVWIKPDQLGGVPRYEELKTHSMLQGNGLALLAGPEKSDAPIHMRQDAFIYLGVLSEGHTLSVPQHGSEYGAWLQLIEGSLKIKNHVLESGDGIGLENSLGSLIETEDDARFLLFIIPNPTQ